MNKTVCIVGGGYAGLTAAVLLKKSGLEVILIDSKDSFLNQIELHKTVHTPVEKFKIQFEKIAEKFDFSYKKETIDWSLLDHQKLRSGKLELSSGSISFDYLIFATGASSQYYDRKLNPESSDSILSLEDCKNGKAFESVHKLIQENSQNDKIFFIGGGATSIQFLFELSDHLKKKRKEVEIHLIDQEEQLLNRFPNQFHKYVCEKLIKEKIHYHPSTLLYDSDQKILKFEDRKSNQKWQSDYRMVFSFPGVKAFPDKASCNALGQLKQSGAALPNVFACGDVSLFEGKGLNGLDAQSAVRKARCIAENIIALENGKDLSQYSYRELGYFVSLGPWDGIGWLLFRFNTLTGLPAFGIKEAIETQFHLFLNGLDTYIDF